MEYGFQNLPKPKRDFKGKSIFVISDDYVVIDLETTGLSPQYDKIIELGAIKVKDGEVVDTYQQLVNPGTRIDEFVVELTGITNEMVQGMPSIQQVIHEYISFIGDSLVVGHNANFDVNFLYDNVIECGLNPFSCDFVDTMRMSRRLFPEYQHHRLKDLKKRMQIDIVGQHRVVADCLTTMQCYEFMKKHMMDNNIDVQQLMPRRKAYVRASDIKSEKIDFDCSHPLYGKVCVFTGTLEKMTRKEAMQIVVDYGGVCGDNITKNTNILVLGNNDYCKTIKDGKSNKQKKAEQYMLAGYDIQIMPESVFYDMIDDVNGGDNVTEYVVSKIAEVLVITYGIANVIDSISYRTFKPQNGYRHYTITYLEKPLLKLFVISDGRILVSKNDKENGISIYSDGFSKLICECFEDLAQKDIGCCSRYEECSDNKKCVQSIPDIFLHCSYRQNLLSGRIFYGKNKNI